MDGSQLLGSPESTDAFKEDAALFIAYYLQHGLTPANISITDLKAGSVVVDFRLLVTRLPSSLAQRVHQMVSEPSSALPECMMGRYLPGGSTAVAGVAQPPPQPLPQPPPKASAAAGAGASRPLAPGSTIAAAPSKAAAGSEDTCALVRAWASSGFLSQDPSAPPQADALLVAQPPNLSSLNDTAAASTSPQAADARAGAQPGSGNGPGGPAAGAIVGGAVGALLALALLGAVGLLIWRKQRSANQGGKVEPVQGRGLRSAGSESMDSMGHSSSQGLPVGLEDVQVEAGHASAVQATAPQRLETDAEAGADAAQAARSEAERSGVPWSQEAEGTVEEGDLALGMCECLGFVFWPSHNLLPGLGFCMTKGALCSY